MKLYRNVMEDLVEALYDDMKDKSGACTCEQCRADAVAYALNQLRPQYVTTSMGESLSKLDGLRLQHTADTRMALTRGLEMVRTHPRHGGA